MERKEKEWSNGYIPPEVIQQVKQMDLLTYLQLYEPYELRRLSSRVYCTKSHDSLKISNGKWMWWSRGIGGRSALDYLVKVREIDFVEAVKLILSCSPVYFPIVERERQAEEKELRLPRKNVSSERAVRYLVNRGIDLEIIDECLSAGVIYEDAQYHSVVFVGYDREGNARYGAYRATDLGGRKGDYSGSDKRYAFRLGNHETETVHLFESAIDLLSYATVIKEHGGDWRASGLLSLSGIYAPKENDDSMKTPVALEFYLTEHPQTKRIVLHLDNDRTGRVATEKIMENLSGEYEVIDEPPPEGKDFNDTLLAWRGNQDRKRRVQEEMER